MLTISGAFPLTSDQPPVAVVSPSALATLMPGFSGTVPQKTTAGFGLVQNNATRLETDASVEAAPGSQIAAQRNPFAIAGPPPAFEANVLEIERRFETILARIELQRTQREMQIGLTPTPEAGLDPPDEGFAEDAPASPGLPPRQHEAEIIRFSPLHMTWHAPEIEIESDPPPRMAIAV